MDRRQFVKTSVAAAGSLWLMDFQKAFAAGTKSSLVGQPWQGWKKGQFQVHFIYTGVAESMFMIFPDGTTMLLDCGDHNAIGRGDLAVPVLPNAMKHSGEWIARYVERVNPNGRDVDYMMLSHYHSDHGGCMKFYASKDNRDGMDYALSGFTQVGETLKFKKAIDRAYPSFDDPLPMSDVFDSGAVRNIKNFYEYHSKHSGLQVERFKLGSTDQIRMLRHPAGNFSVKNICANGRLLMPDGSIKDLYADRIRENKLDHVNENGLSLGMIFSYGDFKFYTAGDFSDKWQLPDGSTYEIEDEMAKICPHVNVAKINHHGHYSMTPDLIKALSAQAYVSCVWDQLHNVDPVMERLADRSLYPGERIVFPGVMPKERRAVDSEKNWMKIVPSASYEGGHIVLNVNKGGKDFSLTYLTAADESMKVRSVMSFTTD